jgi:hypothetical protein
MYVLFLGLARSFAAQMPRSFGCAYPALPLQLTQNPANY